MCHYKRALCLVRGAFELNHVFFIVKKGKRKCLLDVERCNSLNVGHDLSFQLFGYWGRFFQLRQ